MSGWGNEGTQPTTNTSTLTDFLLGDGWDSGGGGGGGGGDTATANASGDSWGATGDSWGATGDGSGDAGDKTCRVYVSPPRTLHHCLY